MDDDLPVYIISSAANLLDIHPRTLYLYEEKGLLVPARKGNRRFYSANDLEWVRTVRYLIHQGGLNLEGLRHLLGIRALLAYQDAPQDRQDLCRDFVGPIYPCWENNPAQSECYPCDVYATARVGLRRDEGVSSLPQ